jgi:hypothetical protein
VREWLPALAGALGAKPSPTFPAGSRGYSRQRARQPRLQRRCASSRPARPCIISSRFADLRNVLAGFFAAHVVSPSLYVPRDGFGVTTAS